MAAQKIKSSTQKFTEVQDIKEDIVILEGSSACLVIEVQATNFALLSTDEQMAKISAYAALLNSLSFPIQILIRNKRIDISSYLKLLEGETQKTENVKVKNYIQNYKAFIQELIKINSVLEKNFYIIISYSYLEKSATGMMKKDDFFNQAKIGLHTKADAILSQLGRLSLRAKILEENALIWLFYTIYNQEIGNGENIKNTFGTTVIKRNEII